MKKRSFTLIELMAVILIIGILMGLVSALIPQLRERARRTQCANNLREVGLAIESYAQDHDFLYPFEGQNQYTEQKQYLIFLKNDKLSAYISDDTIYHCPSAPKKNNINGDTSYWVTMGKDDGFYKPVGPNDVDEEFVMVMDAMIYNGEKFVPNHVKPTYFSNVLFGDGRVKGYVGAKDSFSSEFETETKGFVNIFYRAAFNIPL